MKRLLFSLSVLFFFLTFELYAQPFVFYLSDSISVYKNDEPLEHAWVGGLNSVQVNTIDLDGDDNLDLLLYDRTIDKISTFLNKDGKLQYAPYLEVDFPEFDYWLLLKDYDGDGLKDIFGGTSAGIKVYKNLGYINGRLQWRLIKNSVTTLGFSGVEINLKVDITDVPAISDIDNDGDLDIFNFVPSLGGSVEFHKNLSIENYGHADSLVYEKVTDRWGGLVECGNCGDYFFDGGASCRIAAIKHAGSSLLLFDADNDGDKDFVLGEVDCRQLTFFENKGGNESVIFEDYNPNFIGESPNNLLFPAAFLEDVDFDGNVDLIVSSNLIANESKTEDFAASVWRFAKSGSQQGGFELLEKDYLQKDMLDVGEGAHPAVADVDGDGDLDLFVANKGRPINNNYIASIQLFLNEGSDEQPIFILSDEDYLNLSKFSYQELKIQFTDINGDNNPDLIYTAYQLGSTPAVRYLLNLSIDENNPLSFSTSQINKLELSIERLDEVHFADIDADGFKDVLIGKFRGGELVYYRNLGNLEFDTPINSFGGISFDNFKRELSIETADLDKDGKLELVTGDRSGNITIYPNFQQEIESDFTPLGDTILDIFNQQYVQYNFGAGIYPVVFKEDIIIGTEAGGLRYLRNNKKPIVNSISDQVNNNLLIVYPNPSNNKIQVGVPLTGTIKIYDTQGKLITQRIKSGVNSDIEIEFDKNLSNGLYILIFESKDAIHSKKIVLSR